MQAKLDLHLPPVFAIIALLDLYKEAYSDSVSKL